MWLGHDAWSSFAGVLGLCEAKMLKVYLVWTLGLVEMPAVTNGCERAAWVTTALFLYIAILHKSSFKNKCEIMLLRSLKFTSAEGFY